MTQLETEICPTAVTQEATDLRRHPRLLGIDGKVVRLAVRPEFRGRRALLLDVSVSGIGLLLEHELELETMLVFELQVPERTEMVSRVARVRHCKVCSAPADAPWLPPRPTYSRVFRELFGLKPPQPAGHCWIVGCEFDRALDETEFRHLQLTILRDAAGV